MWLYGFGAVASGVKSRALSAFLMIYYNQVLGLSPAMVSIVITITLICDAIFDPAVGLASDRFRSRWGRRHPFMYISAFPYALGFFLLFNPPGDLSETALVAFMLGSLLLIRLFDSFYELPAGALIPELTPDYHQRTSLVAIRWVVAMVSGIGFTVLAYQVFMPQNPDGSGGILAPEGYVPFAVTGAVIIFAVIMISTAATHHLIPTLRNPPLRKVGMRVAIREIIVTLSNRNFLVLTGSGMVIAIATGLTGGLSLYFSLYFWELDQAQLALLVTISMAGGLTGAALCAPLSRRFGKREAAFGMFIVAMVASTTPIIARLAGVLPENGHAAVFWILATEQFVLSAATLMTSIIVTSMATDVVEECEVQTGRRSEGLLLSADNFFKKLVSGVGVLGTGFILTLVDFPQQARPGEIAPETLQHMALLYVPSCILLFMGAIFLLSRFTINKATHDENLRRLGTVTAPGPGAETGHDVNPRRTE